MICNECPRKCNIDRENSLGFCKSPNEFRLARAALHFWEEPCISGKNGSGTVFFSGCNLKCVFCQNYEISLQNKGMAVSGEKLVSIFEDLINQGANNINLVNPTHYALQIAEVLSNWKSPVPVVYNSSGYESVETLKKLDGLIDIYLPDFKYIRNDKAKKYSNAEDYPEVAKNALKEMRRQVKDTFDENGLMKSGMIIRHLILPQNTNSSIEIINYLKENFEDTYISLMSQYTPFENCKNYPEINRRITKREYEKVMNFAIESKIKKLFLQELSSAKEEYVPSFDFSGVM